MIYLILGVLCSTILIVILKLFPKYKVNTLHGIVINYITCVVFGCIVTSQSPMEVLKGFNQNWTPIALILGLLFITIFNLSALTSQKIGVSVTSMAMKLAFIFPILIGVLVYNESSSFLKIGGIILAIIAVILTSISSGSTSETVSKWLVILPIAVFIGSGACDSLVQYAQLTYFNNGGFELFSVMLFMFAAILGFIFAVVMMIKNKEKLEIQSLVGGILLGIPNYLSIYFLFQTLLKTGWESTVVFPLANISVVISSAIVGLFFFKEQLNKFNIVGLILAIIAVITIIFATQ
jgi:drug/metabolite transporter (DMT)-like permease